MSAWPFGDMRPLSFDFIMADPPWSFDNFSEAGEAKNAKAQYACMAIAEIRALPVSQLAGRDCVLWLWATNPLLPEAIDVLRAWGFTYKTAGHWSKKTPGGKQAFGTGYILRCAGEPFLIGTVGNPACSRSVRSVIEGAAREHSRKPEEAYQAAEQLCPRAMNRADLFSRQIRPGWRAWGNEIERFPAENSSATPPVNRL